MEEVKEVSAASAVPEGEGRRARQGSHVKAMSLGYEGREAEAGIRT